MVLSDFLNYHNPASRYSHATLGFVTFGQLQKVCYEFDLMMIERLVKATLVIGLDAPDINFTQKRFHKADLVVHCGHQEFLEAVEKETLSITQTGRYWILSA